MSLGTLLESRGWRPDATFENTWASPDGSVFIVSDQERQLVISFMDHPEKPIQVRRTLGACARQLIDSGLLSSEDCVTIRLMGYQ